MDPVTLPDAATCTDARAEAEALGDDAQLLLYRDLEAAHSAIPPMIDGVRRSRLLDTDAISTTWEGWSVAGGQRIFLRCIRPRWKDDPVMLRRMARAVGQAPDTSWHPDGDWPHLRVLADGALLLDRFPVEDAPITMRLARLLGEGLLALSRLHDSNITHGGTLAHYLIEGEHGVKIIWLDPFDNQGSVSDDLAGLSRTIAALDPYGVDPIAQLAEEWAHVPPPSAEDGIRLLQRTLAGALLSERHHLAVAGRAAHQFDRSTRLATVVRQFIGVAPPPPAKVCLRASKDGVLVLAESDGEVVRGGAAAGTEGRFLPVVYTPAQGLDAQAARFLLRSWAMREKGDEDQRSSVQAELGATDDQAEHIVRWMSGMARLRAARMLLEATRYAI